MRFARMRSASFGAAVAAAALSAQAVADATRRTPLIPLEFCFQAAEEGGGSSETPPPLLVDGLGEPGLEPDSDDEEARAWFAQGVRLIWAFDEAEAIRAFREAQRRDPGCAMCFLGEAWARSPTINLQPRTEELAAARAAARRAAELATGLGERDRVLVEAFNLRTREGNAFAQARYARFVEAASRRLPDDPTLAILAADARMQISDDIRPGTYGQQALERVLARQPDHVGAIHFYIHLTDWIDRQALAVPYAERLGALAPAASHLVHMPSHTFYGVGRYRDAAAVNVAAIAADTRYVERVRPPRSDYRTGLRAHDMHFAMNSALARGDGETALAVARDFRAEYLAGEVDRRVRPMASSVWFADGLHGEVEATLANSEPADGLQRIFHHYARGEALARRGDGAAVAREALAVARLRDGAEAASFGRNGQALAKVLQHVLEGRAAMLAGDFAAAAAAYRRGMNAQLDADFGADPPLFWYSVRRSLAAALLAGGDAAGARRQLAASLRHWPDDAPALYALSLAERRLGDIAAADASLARARAVWAGDVTSLPLGRI